MLSSQMEAGGDHREGGRDDGRRRGLAKLKAVEQDAAAQGNGRQDAIDVPNDGLGDDQRAEQPGDASNANDVQPSQDGRLRDGEARNGQGDEHRHDCTMSGVEAGPAYRLDGTDASVEA